MKDNPLRQTTVSLKPLVGVRSFTAVMTVLGVTAVGLTFAFMLNEQRTMTSVATVGSCGGATGLVTDAGLLCPPSDLGRPAALTPFIDPTFNTTVQRIAGDTGTMIPGGFGTWSSDVRHHYSKDQPWNADQTLLAIDNSGGTPGRLLLDGTTYQPRFGPCVDDDGPGLRRSYDQGDDRWHPSGSHRNERVNVSRTSGTWYLEWFDVVDCQQTRVWSQTDGSIPLPLDGYLGPWEGNVSSNGRYAALSGTNPLTGHVEAFMLDMDPQPPLAPYPNRPHGTTFDLSACGLTTGCAVDWISVSPSGRYLVVSYEGDHPQVFDVNLDASSPTYLAVAPRDYLAAGLTPKECNPSEGHDAAAGFIYDLGHADMTWNPYMTGSPDVLVGQRRSWCNDDVPLDDDSQAIGSVVMVRLSDGWVKTLTAPTVNGLSEASSAHISARNALRSGWIYVGYHTTTGTVKRFHDEVVAVRLDGAAVERLGHKRSVYDKTRIPPDGCYECESHAVPSPDGTRVLYASNWSERCGASCGALTDIKPYLIDSRPLRTTSGGGGPRNRGRGLFLPTYDIVY